MTACYYDPRYFRCRSVIALLPRRTLIIAYSAIIPSFLGSEWTVPRRQWERPKICMLGSAETISTARWQSQQFSHIPAYFVVWGEDIAGTGSNVVPKNMANFDRTPHDAEAYTTFAIFEQHPHNSVTYLAGMNTTHAQAWALAYQHIQGTLDACEYYFTNDDDLTWSMTDVGTTYNAAKATVEDALMNYLEEWRPAITVFPWPYADQEPSYANQMLMVSKYSSELVQPATGF